MTDEALADMIDSNPGAGGLATRDSAAPFVLPSCERGLDGALDGGGASELTLRLFDGARRIAIVVDSGGLVRAKCAKELATRTRAFVTCLFRTFPPPAFAS